MKKLLLFFAFFLFTAGAAEALSSKQIEKYLKNHKEAGYKYLRSEGKDTWYVSFKLPEWENEWSVVLILLKDENGHELVGIGTTVYRSDTEPSGPLMNYLLERNADDMNLGSFGLYKSDKYLVQYWIKIPNQYLKIEDQLAYSVGFVSGYANAMVPEIEKFFTE